MALIAIPDSNMGHELDPESGLILNSIGDFRLESRGSRLFDKRKGNTIHYSRTFEGNFLSCLEFPG